MLYTNSSNPSYEARCWNENLIDERCIIRTIQFAPDVTLQFICHLSHYAKIYCGKLARTFVVNVFAVHSVSVELFSPFCSGKMCILSFVGHISIFCLGQRAFIALFLCYIILKTFPSPFVCSPVILLAMQFGFRLLFVLFRLVFHAFSGQCRKCRWFAWTTPTTITSFIILPSYFVWFTTCDGANKTDSSFGLSRRAHFM